MKRIKSYTTGWDTQLKEGYISLIDEQGKAHLLSKIEAQEFSLILAMLQSNQLYLDNHNWIISGWKVEK